MQTKGSFIFYSEYWLCFFSFYFDPIQGSAWYDYTTNYCNMRNLMVGAGLVELEGYKEESSTDLCMQYDRIMEFGNCNKF